MNTSTEGKDENANRDSEDLSAHVGEVYEDNSLWYFRNTLGEQVGPFRYASEAKSNLELLLMKLQTRLKPEQ